MKKAYFIFLIMILSLTACGSKDQQTEDTNTLIPVKVSIQFSSDPIKQNQMVTIQATVTQGSDKVDDANEVKFEIWKEGQTDDEIIEAKHEKDGIYSIQKKFKAAGVYDMIAHVTARDMHTMPQTRFTVLNK